MWFFVLKPDISNTRGDVASAAAGGSGIAGGRVLPEGWFSWRVACLGQGERKNRCLFLFFFYLYIYIKYIYS